MDSLIDARLAAGEHEQVLGQLRAAVIADPGRERTCEQLMRACHAPGCAKRRWTSISWRAGRRSSSRAQSRGPYSRVLYQRILAEETATDYGLARHAARRARPRFLAGSRPPPRPISPAGERDGGDRRAASEVPEVPVTVVSGGPGMGKSAAASVAAVQLRRRFTDGQLYAELGGVSPRAIRRTYSPTYCRRWESRRQTFPKLARPARRCTAPRSSGRKVLVIADDAVSAAQVRPLIPAAGGGAVIVTSRSRLSGLAGARHIEIGGLPDEEALSMLDRAAGAEDSREPEAARAIVERCGGMPLAIRLAGEVLAARPGLSLAALALELTGGQVLDVLVAEDVSVREAIGASYARSPPPPGRVVSAGSQPPG